jgi:hypothetical protein
MGGDMTAKILHGSRSQLPDKENHYGRSEPKHQRSDPQGTAQIPLPLYHSRSQGEKQYLQVSYCHASSQYS